MAIPAQVQAQAPAPPIRCILHTRHRFHIQFGIHRGEAIPIHTRVSILLGGGIIFFVGQDLGEEEDGEEGGGEEEDDEGKEREGKEMATSMAMVMTTVVSTGRWIEQLYKQPKSERNK